MWMCKYCVKLTTAQKEGKEALFRRKSILDIFGRWGYNIRVVYGLVAQLGAHHIRIVGVGSSNLLKSTKKEGEAFASPSFLRPQRSFE